MSTSENSSRKSNDGVIARIVKFWQEVIAELKKVITPTKQELVSYSTTVLLFVLVMIVIVFALDMGFGWLARFAFAGN
ncbi:preprotein translocase subunit SecE [Dermabacteraceae bacterium P13115]|nr:preprotein translocase subunit SecE [Dermabacteraceae bacterium TAE3-ERU5]